VKKTEKDASDIKKQIVYLEKELINLQNECSHSEKIIKFGNSRVCKFCKVCQKKIGYPNETELRDNGFK